MQRLVHRCPCCDQPLAISWDMWGKYYLCGGCGFTAEDDDDLRAGNVAKDQALQHHLGSFEAQHLSRTSSRR